MSAWLGKIDPNTVITLVTLLAGFLWHQFASPAAQQKAAASWQAALDVAEKIMGQLVAAAPRGTTQAELEAMLVSAANTQLAHIGLDPSKLPPAVSAAVKALVARVLSQLPAQSVSGGK